MNVEFVASYVLYRFNLVSRATGTRRPKIEMVILRTVVVINFLYGKF